MAKALTHKPQRAYYIYMLIPYTVIGCAIFGSLIVILAALSWLLHAADEYGRAVEDEQDCTG